MTSPPSHHDAGRRTPPALAFFGGDDEYAVEEAATAFGDRVAGRGPRLERWRVAGREITLEALVARLGSAPLFGAGTLVLLTEPERLVGSPSPARRRELVDRLLDSVAPGNALAVLDLPTPGKKPSATAAALKAGIEARGGIVKVFEAPKKGTMTSWILDRAAERGIRLEPPAAVELASRVGAFVEEGDVDRRAMARLASSELDKLALYRGSEPVRVEDVRALVAEAVPASMWAALDALGERRLRGTAARPGTLALLDRLIELAPRPLVVAQLHRRLRELVEVRSALDTGTRAPDIARSLKLHPYRAEKLAGQAARWTLPELEAALEGLLALDLRFKNVPPGTDAQQRLDLVLWCLEHVAPRRNRRAVGRPVPGAAVSGRG